MDNDEEPKVYQTHTLPEYVMRHFGGPRNIKLVKLKAGVYKFTGGGTEVIVNAETAPEARRRIRKIVQDVNPQVLEDGRVARHKLH